MARFRPWRWRRTARAGLIDRGDFASETSQSSSNLIWGGIKYLERLEFPLVWHLCGSRNRLLDVFPGSVREIRFLTLPGRGIRQSLPALYAGTWLYWLLGRCRTRPPGLVSGPEMAAREPALEHRLWRGLEYSDAWLPGTDARFTLDLAFSAVRHGAAALNYAEAMGAVREKDGWLVRVRDRAAGKNLTCGPRGGERGRPFRRQRERCLALKRGSGMFFKGRPPDSAASQQRRGRGHLHNNGRPFYHALGELTMIGTTDTPVERPEEVDEDRRFILNTANLYLKPGRRSARAISSPSAAG